MRKNMATMLRKILTLSLMVFCLAGGAFAGPLILSGSAAVNVTSDTAATAKNIAFDNARRQIVRDALSPYADKEQLAAAIKGASASDLANLIASSSIDGEQQSATTYSANITMNLDTLAARRWLGANNVQSWLPEAGGGNQILVVVNLRDWAGDWVLLNRMARGENIELNTRGINGTQMTIEISESARNGFIAAARSSGWQVSNDDGVIKIWK